MIVCIITSSKKLQMASTNGVDETWMYKLTWLFTAPGQYTVIILNIGTCMSEQTV